MCSGHKRFLLHVFWLAFTLIHLGFLAGCLPREGAVRSSTAETIHPAQGMAIINAFLVLEDKQGPAVQFEVKNIEILAKDIWLPLTSGPMRFDSVEIGKSQLFLGSVVVPPGQYKSMRLTVSKGTIKKGDGQLADVLSEPKQVVLTLAKEMNIGPGDSKTLHMTWDVSGALQADNNLTGQFFVSAALRNLSVNLVFAACPEINTIFVVRADKNWVVDSIGVPGRPTYLAIDPSSNHERLYVLASDEKMVKVVDMSSYRVIDAYPTLNDEANYMTISSNGQWAYLLHERSGYVSRMNLRTGQIESRNMLGSRPSYALYMEEPNLLAVSLALNQKVLLLDPENLRIVKTFSTGYRPEGLLVMDNELYVAESGDASVSKYGLSNNAGQSRTMVGYGPRRLVGIDNQVFVSNYNDGSLSVLLTGQLGALQQIYGLGQPFEMVFDRFFRRLYVADELETALTVIDVNSNQILGQIHMGAQPLGLAEIQ